VSGDFSHDRKLANFPKLSFSGGGVKNAKNGKNRGFWGGPRKCTFCTFRYGGFRQRTRNPPNYTVFKMPPDPPLPPTAQCATRAHRPPPKSQIFAFFCSCEKHFFSPIRCIFIKIYKIYIFYKIYFY
jgi:hypothetical protein